MIDYVSSLPTWAGCALSMLLTTVAGLAVYFGFRPFLARYPIEELEDPIGSLFRVIGVLVSLMLSLAFAEVVVGVRTVEAAIQRETAAISDTFKALGQFDSDAARSTQLILLEFTRAVADDDWSALAHDRLGARTDALKAKLTDHVMQLQPSTPAQEKLWSSILTDVDMISDARLTRLQGALAEPPRLHRRGLPRLPHHHGVLRSLSTTTSTPGTGLPVHHVRRLGALHDRLDERSLPRRSGDRTHELPQSAPGVVGHPEVV